MSSSFSTTALQQIAPISTGELEAGAITHVHIHTHVRMHRATFRYFRELLRSLPALTFDLNLCMLALLGPWLRRFN